MAAEPSRIINLFYCYAREDKSIRDELERHLTNLKRQYPIETWHDREISPGIKWEREIDSRLNTAHIILLLVSPDFMAPQYCYGVEMKRALERQEAGTARVVPIIVRPVDWEDAPFSTLQVLPKDTLPVTSWPDRDLAYVDVASGIRKVVRERYAYFATNEGNIQYKNKHYVEALHSYEEAI